MSQQSGILRAVDINDKVTIADGGSQSTPFYLGRAAGFAVLLNAEDVSFTGTLVILHSANPNGPFDYVMKRDYSEYAHIDFQNVTKNVWMPAPTDVFELGGYIKLMRFSDDTFATAVSSGDWSLVISTKG